MEMVLKHHRHIGEQCFSVVLANFELVNSLCHAQAKHCFEHLLPLIPVSKFQIFCQEEFVMSGWVTGY